MGGSAVSFEIQDLRVAFLFFEVWLDPFLIPSKQRGWVSPDRKRWSETFDTIARRGGHGHLTFPWSDRADYGSWADYFEEEEPSKIGARRAWSLLVPFRTRRLSVVKPLIPSGRAWVEAFVYPHSVEAVVNLALSVPLTLEGAVESVANLREKKMFVLPSEDGNTLRLRLSEVAERAIKEARVDLAKRAPQSRVIWDPNPFEVVSVVRATGQLPSMDDGGPVHKALHSFSGGSGRVGNAKLQRFLIKEGSMSKRDLFYGRQRGRAVWFPEYFRPTTATGARDPHFLGRFHRRLVLASVQTESLLGPLVAVDERLRSGHGSTLPYWLRACAKNAAGTIGRIYGGKLWTEHTGSLRGQIEQIDRGLVWAASNRVRDYFDMPLLHTSA